MNSQDSLKMRDDIPMIREAKQEFVWLSGATRMRIDKLHAKRRGSRSQVIAVCIEIGLNVFDQLGLAKVSMERIVNLSFNPNWSTAADILERERKERNY